MAYTIIDRTLNGKRSSGNRSKFIRRVRKNIKSQVDKQIAEGNIDDLVSGKGKKVTVPKKNLSQPTFKHGKGGKREFVHTGNKEFVEGDRIQRPPEGEGGPGGGASKDGQGEDSFEFTLTHDEFLDMFFHDCELPDLRETVIAKTDKYSLKRAGFATDGPMSQLNLERTMRMSKGRRIGLFRKKKKKELEELILKEASLLYDIAELEAKEVPYTDLSLIRLKKELEVVQKRITVLRRKLKAVPFIDDVDLRFNHYIKQPVPIAQAVMFCLMDVSGSMTQWHKEMAKRYFMLLYLFLNRNYERVEVVWIRHHTIAKLVDEKEFFHSRETGGTLVSTALDMMTQVVEQGGTDSSGKKVGPFSPAEWNIYASQVSDGDNWQEDTHVALDLLKRKILPITQYYTYIEIEKSNGMRMTDLWPKYESISKQHNNFQMRRVTDASDIYPVFQQLFRKNKRAKNEAREAKNAA